MYKIKVNGSYNFELASQNDLLTLNGQEIFADIYQINISTFSVILNNRSYRAELIDFDRNEKVCKFKINNNYYHLQITDRYDDLLKKLGLDVADIKKVIELKAPMPGMVLKIFVNEGDEVKKGDNLLVLEAMKMENILKSPENLKIRSINVSPSQKVEKNQLMITFE